MEVLRQCGNHRLISFSDHRGGFFYRSETIGKGILIGSTYSSLGEAEADYEATLARVDADLLKASRPVGIGRRA